MEHYRRSLFCAYFIVFIELGTNWHKLKASHTKSYRSKATQTMATHIQNTTLLHIYLLKMTLHWAEFRVLITSVTKQHYKVAKFSHWLFYFLSFSLSIAKLTLHWQKIAFNTYVKIIETVIYQNRTCLLAWWIRHVLLSRETVQHCKKRVHSQWSTVWLHSKSSSCSCKYSLTVCNMCLQRA